ncbi:MAG: chemotaxis protein CheD [Planctomycetota bacterium]
MHLPEEVAAARAVRVGIGEFAVGGPGDAFRVTLGSCVGLCLVWGKGSRFAVAHVLLPSRRHGVHAEASLASRFADSAAQFLFEQLGEPERPRDVVAYVAGGSAQFDREHDAAPVGDLNVENTRAALAAARIRVVQEDLGGAAPRQLVVDGTERRILSIRYADEPECTTWEMPTLFGKPKAA